MPRVNKRKLQSLINKTVKHGAVYYATQAALNEYCIEVYGREPGDVDCDSIIDRIFGGDGVPNEMSAEEFDQAMLEALKHA